MNFFGHAVIASWEARTPGFVLGAMLPDLASMSRTRLVEVNDPHLRAGVTLHHRTDQVFHAASGFVSLCREARRALLAVGMTRGCARAVGHVGVELLLDGWLVEQREASEIYAAALRCGRERELGRCIRWSDPTGRARWRALRRRLEHHGPPRDYRNPAVVASRIERILRDRPCLALDARSLEIATGHLPELQQAVHAHAEPLIGALREALTRAGSRLTQADSAAELRRAAHAVETDLRPTGHEVPGGRDLLIPGWR